MKSPHDTMFFQNDFNNDYYDRGYRQGYDEGYDDRAYNQDYNEDPSARSDDKTLREQMDPLVTHYTPDEIE